MESRTRQAWLKALSFLLTLLAAVPIAHQLYGSSDISINELLWLIVGMLVVGIPAIVLTIQAAIEPRNAGRHSL